MLSIANLATTAPNAKMNKVKSNCFNTTVVTAVENEILDDRKYITTPEFNKSTLENFSARLLQATLGSKNDIANFLKKTGFDNKLRNLSKELLQIKQNLYLLKMN